MSNFESVWNVQQFKQFRLGKKINYVLIPRHFFIIQRLNMQKNLIFYKNVSLICKICIIIYHDRYMTIITIYVDISNGRHM